jgi:hypothetical protein
VAYNTRDRLLEKYPANDTGTWKITGEDPNCDLGGSHHEPELGTVTGTYAKVVEYALGLPGFFQWGYGGDIKKMNATINVDALDPVKLAKLKTEHTNLTARIKEIENELAEMTGTK